MSSVSPQAFAQAITEERSNVDAVTTTDGEQNSTASEEPTAEEAASLKGLGKDSTPAKITDEKSVDNAMQWGVRTSFNNYTHGPSKMIGDATQNAEKNRFTFKLESVTYDESTERLEAKFKGGVQYENYCDTGTCQLDLKIENPRIVISKDGSYVYAKVSSKKYLSSEVYKNTGDDDKKPIAQLYTANATFNNEEGKVTWSEIPAALTKDGAEMFSNFYAVGGGLDSLTFSFDKSKLGDKASAYKRLSTDNAKYLVASEKFDDKGLYGNHRELFKYKGNIIVASSHDRFKDHDKAGFALLDRNLGEKSFKHANLNGYGAVAFDENKGDLYYVARKETEYMSAGQKSKRYDEDAKKLYKLHVDTRKGFVGEPTVVHTFADDITAVGYNPATKDVAVVTQKQTAIVNNGQVKPVDLPEQVKLVEGTDFSSPSNLYGQAAYNAEVSELLPMKDGSFILNGDTSSAKKKVDKEEKTYKGLMVSIDPKKTDAPAKLLQDSVTESSNISSSAAHTDGETIVRYNKNNHPSNAVAQSFTFKDGILTKTSEGDVVTGDTSDVKNWGNAVVTDTGALMALDAKDGMIKHVDPKAFKVIKDNKLDEDNRKTENVAIPQGSKTGTHQHGAILQLDKGTFYVPSFDDAAGESKETYVLRKMYDPKYIPKAEESEREYPDNDQNDGDNNTSGSSLSKKWKIVLGVVAGLLGFLGVANHLFGEHIRNFLAQFNIR